MDDELRDLERALLTDPSDEGARSRLGVARVRRGLCGNCGVEQAPEDLAWNFGRCEKCLVSATRPFSATNPQPIIFPPLYITSESRQPSPPPGSRGA